MTDLERCQVAVEQGDWTALLGIADSLADRDDPRAPELRDLAQEIMASPSEVTQFLAATVFFALLEGGAPWRT